MGWWSSFTSAVSSAASTVASTVSSGGSSAWSWTSDAGKRAALQIGDGGMLFSHGWNEVFSGNFQQGVQEVGLGMAEMGGMPLSDDIAKRYEEAVGEASLWSLQKANSNNSRPCMSAYVEQIRLNIQRLGLNWTDAMAQKARDSVASNNMTWIDPGC